jgi:TolB-like protein
VPETAESEQGAAYFPAYLWPVIGGAMAIIVIAVVVLSNRSGKIQRLEAVRSVAVCPFENMSGPAGEIFAFGVREQLLITLSQEPLLRVVKPPCEVPVHEIPEELGVDGVVTGSVQLAGDQVRMVARVQASDGLILWSKHIDGGAADVDEVFVLHEQLADLVLEAILGNSDTEVASSSRPDSHDAYDFYYLGEKAFSNRSEPDLNRAVELYKEAISLDPNYGPAYLGVANSYLLLADYPGGDPESMYEDAIEIANRGAELDPEIQGAVGTVYGFVHTKMFDWAAAANAFETAISASTGNPTSFQTSSHHWYSRFLANIGLLEMSLKHAKLAQEMDTASPILNARLGVAYHWLNDSENADKYYSKAADKEVGSWIHNLAYTLFLIREDRPEEARQKAKEALQSYGQPTSWVDPVFDGFLNSTETAGLVDTVASISAAAASGDLPPNIELTLWVLLGQGDQAMEAAWALQKSGDYFEVEIFYLEEFRVLRQHEEFPELLEALGLTSYWDSIGCHWSGEQVVCEQQNLPDAAS